MLFHSLKKRDGVQTSHGATQSRRHVYYALRKVYQHNQREENRHSVIL